MKPRGVNTPVLNGEIEKAKPYKAPVAQQQALVAHQLLQVTEVS